MKINEIVSIENNILEYSVGGSGPDAKINQKGEIARANKEIAELKKFSPQFANDFKSEFNRIGQTSVDAAYQAAAGKRDYGGGIDKAAKKLGQMAKAGISSDSSDYKRAMQEFQSAMPSKYIRVRSTTADYTGTTGFRGGQYGNQNAAKDGTAKKVLDIGKNAGKNPVADFKAGADLGNQVFVKKMSAPYKTSSNRRGNLDKGSQMAASYKNPKKKL